MTSKSGLPVSGSQHDTLPPRGSCCITRSRGSRASRGHLQAAVGQQLEAVGRLEVILSDALQQVLTHMEECDGMVKTLTAEGPMSSEKL